MAHRVLADRELVLSDDLFCKGALSAGPESLEGYFPEGGGEPYWVRYTCASDAPVRSSLPLVQ